MMKTKLNPASLQAALRSVKQFTSALQELREKKSALQAELKGSHARIDPNDDAALDRLTRMQGKVRLLETLIPAEEEKVEPLVIALMQEIEAFERELLRAAGAERAELLAKISELLRPYCRSFSESGATVDAAERVALQCTVFAALPSGRIGACTLPSSHRSGAPAQFDAAVIARAEELLAIHTAAAAAGSFVPSGFTDRAA